MGVRSNDRGGVIMKKKGITILVVLTLLVVGLACMADAGHWGRFGMKPTDMFMFRMDMLADELDITDAQREDIKSIIDEKRPEYKPLVEDLMSKKQALQELVLAEPVDEEAIRQASLEIGAKIAQLSIMASEAVREVRFILSPEQLQKLTELRRKKMEARNKAMARWKKRLLED
jgi:Spy/CpxP family protein refolding chaperone